MRRIRLVLALAGVMVTMLVLSAVPALADTKFKNNNRFDSSFEQRSTSGDIDISNRVSSSGNNSNQTAPVLQFGNTGNIQNQVGFTSFGFDDNNFDNGDGFFFDDGNGFGDVEIEGSSFDFSPEQDVGSTQSIQQSSAAWDSWWWDSWW